MLHHIHMSQVLPQFTYAAISNIFYRTKQIPLQNCLKSPIFSLFVPPYVSRIRQSKHQNSPLLAFCGGNPPVTSGFPSQSGQ